MAVRGRRNPDESRDSIRDWWMSLPPEPNKPAPTQKPASVITDTAAQQQKGVPEDQTQEAKHVEARRKWLFYTALLILLAIGAYWAASSGLISGNHTVDWASIGQDVSRDVVKDIRRGEDGNPSAVFKKLVMPVVQQAVSLGAKGELIRFLALVSVPLALVIWLMCRGVLRKGERQTLRHLFSQKATSQGRRVIFAANRAGAGVLPREECPPDWVRAKEQCCENIGFPTVVCVLSGFCGSVLFFVVIGTSLTGLGALLSVCACFLVCWGLGKSIHTALTSKARVLAFMRHAAALKSIQAPIGNDLCRELLKLSADERVLVLEWFTKIPREDSCASIEYRAALRRLNFPAYGIEDILCERSQ